MPSPRGHPPTGTPVPVCLREKLKSSRFSRRQRFQAAPSARKQKKILQFFPSTGIQWVEGGKKTLKEFLQAKGKKKVILLNRVFNDQNLVGCVNSAPYCY
ncbi:MAG: hypothetical protein KME26_02665 [Oscillatoria princeps RMCB-10]|jgi:hypothetical protein|nr:hypothetical protein [Oscillatoria princeps RMCB-10]